MKAQYGTCRGKAPPSCCRKTVLSLKVPAGDFIVPLRSTNANLSGRGPSILLRKTVLSLKVPTGDFIVPLRSTNANLSGRGPSILLCKTVLSLKSPTGAFIVPLRFTNAKFFKDKTNREIRAYFAYALKFLEGRQCPDTFLSAVVHMDEKTPHLHLCFVPLTADGRLSAKEIIGNRKNLVRWQDEFWQHMVKQYPELERGESASQTGREHIPPRIFKEMTLLTKQKEQLDALLVGITPFNGKSRAAEISKVLDSYIPNVARMRDQLRKYNVAFTKTAAENEKLKEKNKTLSASLDKAKEGSVLKRLEDAKLRQDYEAALKTLDSIPPEVIRFYENRTQEPVVHHDK